MLPRTVQRIQKLALRKLQPVTIQQLLVRSNFASDEGHVFHAQWCRDEFPVRLAHRINDFLRLPYIVFKNERFYEVFQMFNNTFEELADHPEMINDLAGAEKFAEMLRRHVRSHDNIIHLLQEGYRELDGLKDLDAFLNQFFFTRIGNRVLAEHYLIVHEARARGDENECTGIVTPSCSPKEITLALTKSLSSLCSELYGVEPKVAIIGEVDVELSFVHEHLYFVLQEVLKNAMRATIEHEGGQRELPHITVEIMKGLFDVTIKVSDCGGGMPKEQLAKIWKYGYTSASSGGDDDGLLSDLCGQDVISLRQIAGYGFGLPLSRVYAQYFGGDIHLQTMPGYGTDVYLNINHLGDMHQESNRLLVAC